MVPPDLPAVETAPIPAPPRAPRKGILRAIGIRKGGDSDPTEPQDPFYEQYGTAPDELAEAWEAYHASGVALAADPEFNDCFTSLKTELSRRVVTPDGKRKSVKLNDGDRLGLVEVFRELGRASDIGLTTGARFLIDHAAAKDGGEILLGETFKVTKEIKSQRDSAEAWAESIFKDRPESELTSSATSQFLGKLLDAKAEAKRLSKPVHGSAVKIYTVTEEIISSGPEGARWLIEDLVLGSIGEGHDERGKQMLANQLIAQYKSMGETSLLAQAMRTLREAITSGGLIKEYCTTVLAQNDGDNVHAFYQRLSGQSVEDFIEQIACHFADLPPELAAEYNAYAQARIRDLSVGISSLGGKQHLNYGPVDFDSIIQVAAQLRKKMNPHKKIIFTPVVGDRAQRGLDTRVRGAGALASPEVPLKEPRQVQGLRRVSQGFLAVEEPIKEVVEQANIDTKLVEAIKLIIEDLAKSQRFKYGVAKLPRLTGKLIDSRKPGATSRIVFRRVDCKEYPVGTIPRSGRGSRIIFAIGPNREILLYGIYADHASYEAALRNLARG